MSISTRTPSRRPSWLLVGIEGAPPPHPPHARQPRLRRPHRRRAQRAPSRCVPPGEPCCRRAWVQSARTRDVFSPVLEHVDQTDTDFARRPKLSRVVAIAPYRAPPTEDVIHCLREPHREALTAARQACMVVCLDEQMQVIALDAELKQPEARAGGGGERAAHGREDRSTPERGEAGSGTQRDVHRHVAIVRSAATVRNLATPRCRGATSAPATATPRAEDEVGLARALHLETGRDYIKLARMSSLRKTRSPPPRAWGSPLTGDSVAGRKRPADSPGTGTTPYPASRTRAREVSSREGQAMRSRGPS